MTLGHTTKVQRDMITKLALYVQDITTKNRSINSTHTVKIHYLMRDKSLFYDGLFKSQHAELSIFIDELNHSMASLKKQLDSSRPLNTERLQYLIEKVSHQHRALQSVLKQCHVANKQQPAPQNSADENYDQILKKLLNKSHYLYKKLAQQHEYERRLQDMITQASSEATKQQTQDRLARCQLATKQVEQQIARYEQKQDLG